MSGSFNLSLPSLAVLAAVLNSFWHIIAFLSVFRAWWDGQLIMDIAKGLIGAFIDSFILHGQAILYWFLQAFASFTRHLFFIFVFEHHGSIC